MNIRIKDGITGALVAVLLLIIIFILTLSTSPDSAYFSDATFLVIIGGVLPGFISGIIASFILRNRLNGWKRGGFVGGFAVLGFSVYLMLPFGFVSSGASTFLIGVVFALFFFILMIIPGILLGALIGKLWKEKKPKSKS